MDNKTDNTPMLTIRCLVYNHEPYLRQCLDGFIMQQTDFKFEAVVHDDASTDGSAAIIREYAERYPDIIKPIFETENQYSKPDDSLTRIMNAAMRGKYVAVCEGDDYWTDPLKLQKQVDFLEAHPDYGMVHTRADVFYQDENKFLYGEYGNSFESFDELLIQNCISTLTACFRSEFIQSYNKNVVCQSEWLMGDYPLWLYIAMKSKIHRLNESTSVYRCLGESASHSKNFEMQIQFILNVYSVQYYFMKKTHKEYLQKKIVQNRFAEIIDLHIDNNKKLNLNYYKRKFHIKSLGGIYTLKVYLRMLKHGILDI